MWIQSKQPEKVKWDPQKAHEAYIETRKSIMAGQLRATARSMPDSEMVKEGVKIPGAEPEVIAVDEYALRLEIEAEQAKLVLAQVGGIMAVREYVLGRHGISYAGEAPVPHASSKVSDVGIIARIRL